MKPIIIIPPGVMSASDIKKLEGNMLCVVVAKDPGKVKFLDPIPVSGNRDKIESAAIHLSRVLLNGQWSGPSSLGKVDICKLFVDFLVSGTPLDSKGTIEEQCDNTYRQERLDEAIRMARADAKAEREAKKKAQAALPPARESKS